MRDSELINVFASLLENALAAEGLTSVPVAQLLQPTQQSREESGEGVYFQFLYSHRYGTKQSTREYNETNNVFVYTDMQQMIATVQISVFYPADPSDVSRMSSRDLAEQLCMRMQTEDAIQTFRTAGAGIVRITDVRNPNFDNEQEQSEFVPNFDMQINYNRTVDSNVGVIVEVIGDAVGIGADGLYEV